MIILRYLEGRTQREIAEALNLNVKRTSVQKSIGRGLGNLRTSLRKHAQAPLLGALAGLPGELTLAGSEPHIPEHLTERLEDVTALGPSGPSSPATLIAKRTEWTGLEAGSSSRAVLIAEATRMPAKLSWLKLGVALLLLTMDLAVLWRFTGSPSEGRPPRDS